MLENNNVRASKCEARVAGEVRQKIPCEGKRDVCMYSENNKIRSGKTFKVPLNS